MTVKPPEHNAKSACTTKTGRFALLCAFRRVKGTSAPSSSRRSAFLVPFLTPLILVSFLLTPSAANATFTRKFERAIYRSGSSGGHPFTERCTEAEAGTPGTTCLIPGGIAVNSEDDLWLGSLELTPKNRDLIGSELIELEPAYPPGDNAPDLAGSFKVPRCVEDKGKGTWEESSCLTETTKHNAAGEREGDFEKSAAPQTVAIERGMLSGNGDFYTAGDFPNEGNVEVYESDGTHVETWNRQTKPLNEPLPFEEPKLAIDDSTEPFDPSACGKPPLETGECFVYVATKGDDGVPSRLEKFNSKGVKESFTAPGLPYVHGNEITGSPAGTCTGNERFPEDGGAGALTVDPEGDIYVVASQCRSVLEYAPSGEYLRAFDLESPGVPRVGSEEASGAPVGVAYDPVSHDLVIAATASIGMIDEFEATTGRFVAQIASTPEGQLENPKAVAVDSRGDVYVAEDEIPATPGGSAARGRNALYVFGPGAYYPTVTLGQASDRTSTGAVLSGSVNPAQKGNPTPAPVSECHFQYIGEEAYEKNLAAKQEEGFKGAKVAQCVPGSVSAEPEAFTEVHAKIGESPELLTPGETYRYRLIATTEKTANGGTAETESFAFTAPAPPKVVSASAANLSSTSADLHAEINPLGADTSYFFEYGPSTAYGHTIPSPPASIGSGGPTGSSVEGVLQHVGGLQPGTTYHFRVLASSECEAIEHPHTQCVTPGEDQTFTTLPAPPVSGERGYELVTPANKQGGSDMFAEPIIGDNEFHDRDNTEAPAEDGEGFLLQTRSSFGEFPFASGGTYVFRREYARGQWGYTSLAAPSLGVQQLEGFPLFEPFAMATVAFGDGVGSVAGEEGRRIMSLVGPPGGPYVKLDEDPPIHGTAETLGFSTTVVGASRDLSHVVLESGHTTLCAGGETVKHGEVLCEWAGGEPQLVNTKPGSETEPASECGGLLGNGLGYGAGYTHNAVSEDGARVFFTAPDRELVGEDSEERAKLEGKDGCWNDDPNQNGEGLPVNAPQLYVRDETHEAGEVAHEVLEVSAPEPGVTEPGSKEPAKRPTAYPVVYAGASADGSRVFFLTQTELTKEAVASNLHDEELYEWEAEGSVGPTGTCAESGAGYVPASKGCLTRISAGETGNVAGEAYAVAATSADGSSVYFLADGVLAANLGANGTRAAPGHCGPSRAEGGVLSGCNLYRYDTATGTTTYIATVDELAFSVFSANGQAPSSSTAWYTTPDGRYLLFKSNLPLTSYSNAGSSCLIENNGGGTTGQPCAEVYRYDADASEKGEQPLVCVSCGQGTTLPTGNASFTRSAPESEAAAAPVRAMSDNGEYAFFDTPTPLVSQATNGTLNTYEWHDGQISLIGSGTDPAPTYFLGYSPYYLPDGTKVEGGNVFIGTHAKLSPVQTNSVGNVYDARVCEPESPCIQPPAGETAQCEGGSCQTPPAAPSDPVATLLAPPPSATPAPSTTIKVTKKVTQCKRGFVRKRIKRKGVCVKKPKPKKRAKKASTDRRATR